MSAGLAATAGQLEKATTTSHSVSQTGSLDPALEAAYTTIEDLRNVILPSLLFPFPPSDQSALVRAWEWADLVHCEQVRIGKRMTGGKKI